VLLETIQLVKLKNVGGWTQIGVDRYVCLSRLSTRSRDDLTFAREKLDDAGHTTTGLGAGIKLKAEGEKKRMAG
jgi:hypothetical protein